MPTPAPTHGEVSAEQPEQPRARSRTTQRIGLLFDQLGPDPSENIRRIVQNAAEIIGGACSLYNRLNNKSDSLVAWAGYNLPEDFPQADTPHGHICYDVTMQSPDRPVVLTDLAKTSFETTDPNVKRYKLRSYLGFPVVLGETPVGALCVVDTQPRHFSADEIDVLATLAKAISLEEARQQSIDALVASEQRFRTIYEAIPDPVAILRIHDGCCVEINGMFSETFGYTRDEIIGTSARHIPIWQNGETRTHLLSELTRTGQVVNLESDLTCRDGSVLSALISALPIDWEGQPHLLTIARNITELALARQEQQLLRQQLGHAAKLEAIGTLAGGIAHDFNNILGIIVGNVEMATAQSSADADIQERLSEIRNASFRARDVIRQLLDISRKNPARLEPVAVGSMLSDFARLLRSSIPANISVTAQCEPAVGVLCLDPAQLNQLLLNLSTNASHAMETNGGRLTITGRIVHSTGTATTMGATLEAPPYLNLMVADTGDGIEPAVMNRIFDPYFSTKESDKGSGIGLAVVQGIVKAAKGAISVSSTVGQGTRFDIYLPARQGRAASNHRDTIPSSSRSGHVLYVDDDLSLLAITTAMLESGGYRVTAMADPEAAVTVVKQSNGGIDAIVSDMSMPGLTGADVLRAIQAIPDAPPVILLTGYASQVDEDQAQKMGFAAYLEKPVDSVELCNAVHRVIMNVRTGGS